MELTLNQNFVEMLRELSACDAEFLIVGGHAVGIHGYIRATLDFDVWVRPTRENAERVYRALARFGAPMHDVTVEELSTPDMTFQIGVKPTRIDIITGISGVLWEEAWPSRVDAAAGGARYPVIGKQDLIRNKLASARPQDLVDADKLSKIKFQ